MVISKCYHYIPPILSNIENNGIKIDAIKITTILAIIKINVGSIKLENLCNFVCVSSKKICSKFNNELSKLADVELRSIQMYEQRRNNINKAQVETIYKLATVLDCNIEDLLEE